MSIFKDNFFLKGQLCEHNLIPYFLFFKENVSKTVKHRTSYINNEFEIHSVALYLSETIMHPDKMQMEPERRGYLKLKPCYFFS